MRSRAWRYGLILGAGIGSIACGAQSPGARPQACAPLAEGSRVSIEAEKLAGEYGLVLVATVGEAAGRSAEGRLRLYSNEPELRSLPAAGGGVRSDASAPLYGATDVDPEAVGGLRLGDPMSRDPSQPGVLLIEQGEQIVLRFGSEANRRGIQRFDGGYFVLRVQQADEGGFAGSWASGLLEVQAEGHFCATASVE